MSAGRKRWEVVCGWVSLWSGPQVSVIYTVRWEWLARLLVLTYRFPGSPAQGAWYRRKA